MPNNNTELNNIIDGVSAPIWDLEDPNFLKSFMIDSQASSVQDSKIDNLVKGMQTLVDSMIELKAMVTNLTMANRLGSGLYNGKLYCKYNSRNDVDCIWLSIFLESSSFGHSNQKVKSLFDNVLNNPEKMQQIVAHAKSNRGSRIFHKKQLSVDCNIPATKKKDLMLSMCTSWLKTLGTTYGMSTLEEEDAKRNEDALSRYDSTYSLVNLFCKTVYAEKEHTFRYDHLGIEIKQELAFAVEHVVLQTLGTEGCLPLQLAEDSWAAAHLISIVLRNEGTRKQGILKRV